MITKLLSEIKNGFMVRRKYACSCGKGMLKEEQEYTPGHRAAFVSLWCKECEIHSSIDFGKVKQNGGYATTIQATTKTTLWRRQNE